MPVSASQGSVRVAIYTPVDLDHFAPFEDNYFFRNFAFNASSLDTTGTSDNGWSSWGFDGYGPLGYVNTRYEFPTFDYVTYSNQAPVPAILASSTTGYVGYFDSSDITDFGAYHSG